MTDVTIIHSASYVGPDLPLDIVVTAFLAALTLSNLTE